MTSQVGAGPRELDAALDGVIERYGHGQWVETVAAARARYAERTGRVYQDEELYEARTVAFLEWYALEAELDGGRPPVVRALAEETAADRVVALRAWATSHRSLYSVEEIDARRIGLLDLWGGARFDVDERRRLHGVAKGDVIEARLVGWRGRVRFGRTFAFHPAAARAAIIQQLRRLRTEGKPRGEGMDLIGALQVKAIRWKHIDVARVYAGEPEK